MCLGILPARAFGFVFKGAGVWVWSVRLLHVDLGERLLAIAS